MMDPRIRQASHGLHQVPIEAFPIFGVHKKKKGKKEEEKRKRKKK